MTNVYKLHADLDNLYQPEPKAFVTHKNSQSWISLTISKSNMFDFSLYVADLMTRVTQKTMTSDGPKVIYSGFTYSDTYKCWIMPVDTTYAGTVKIDVTIIYDGDKKITLPTVFGIIKEGG